MRIETARDILARKDRGESYRQIALAVGLSHQCCWFLCKDPMGYPVEPWRCECGASVTTPECVNCRAQKSVK